EPVAQPLGAVLLGDELLQGGQVVSVGAFEPGQRLFEFSRGGAGFRGGGEGGRQGLQGRGEVGAGGLEVGGDGVPAADGGQGARRGVQRGLCGGDGGGRAGGLLQQLPRVLQAFGQRGQPSGDLLLADGERLQLAVDVGQLRAEVRAAFLLGA